MRPSAWVSFLAVFLLAAGLCHGVSTAQARSKPPAPDRLPSWVVTGGWWQTPEEAVEKALEAAQGKVNEYLRAQNPRIEWPIDRTYLQQKLWRDLKADDPAFKAAAKPAEGTIATPCATFCPGMSPSTLPESESRTMVWVVRGTKSRCVSESTVR